MKEVYIYNNPYLGIYRKIIDHEDLMKLTSGIVISLCSSYLTTETNAIFRDLYSNNGSNMIMAREVFEEINDKESNAFHCGYSTEKYEIALNIPKVSPSSDATCFPELLHTEGDKSAILVAKDYYNGIAVATDYHEVTNALYLNVPFIFKIPKDELEKYNGPENYREMFFHKKVDNLLKEIKNKKHEHLKNYRKK